MSGFGRDPHLRDPLQGSAIGPTGPNGEAPSERLRRLAEWCVTAQLTAAELELSDWQRQSDCPIAARVLLTALLARRGEAEHARTVLQPATLGETPDPLAAQTLIGLLVTADLTDTASRLVQRLHHSRGDEPSVQHWLAALRPPGFAEPPPLPDTQVARLADELDARLDLLPTLVAAQRIASSHTEIALLRAAVARLARRAADDEQRLLAVCQAMAELSLLANDADEARRWTHRGLKVNPFAASLAMVLAQLDDDTEVGPPAIKVLAVAAEAHPQFPDLQAALIRREHAQGETASARMHLADWLRREPEHPLARKLEQELAA